MLSHLEKNLNNYTFIDLFAGIGGFRIALESLGARCVYSNEWDKFAKEVYFKNFNEIPDDDITKVNAKDIPDHDILCAGFPCQAFSISGKQLGFDDSRGTLFYDVARIIKEKKPKYLILENVKNFKSHDKGRTLQTVLSILDELGYDIYFEILNARDYGIPQNRERIFFLGIRNDLNINEFFFPEPIELIKSLEDLLLEEDEVEHLYKDYDGLTLLDRKKENSNRKLIKLGYVNKGGQGERIYSPKGIAVTLSSYGGGKFAKTGGYLINDRVRKLHPRECARLMGFPDSFKYSDSSNQAYKQFGNSVVVDIIQLIAYNLGETIKNASISK